MEESMMTLMAMLAVVTGCFAFAVYLIYKLRLKQSQASDRLEKISEAIERNRSNND